MKIEIYHTTKRDLIKLLNSLNLVDINYIESQYYEILGSYTPGIRWLIDLEI